ncbi:hypothetical protein VTO42DRAFT_3728 [Malbranchea cinnamomea]
MHAYDWPVPMQRACPNSQKKKFYMPCKRRSLFGGRSTGDDQALSSVRSRRPEKAAMTFHLEHNASRLVHIGFGLAPLHKLVSIFQNHPDIVRVVVPFLVAFGALLRGGQLRRAYPVWNKTGRFEGITLVKPLLVVAAFCDLEPSVRARRGLVVEDATHLRRLAGGGKTKRRLWMWQVLAGSSVTRVWVRTPPVGKFGQSDD